MRYREPFTLYSRKMADGRRVWYYRTYDEYGERTSGRSTGKTSKTLARRYCTELYRQGRLVPSADPLFRDYAAPWWKWESCPYVRGRRERSAEGRLTISRRYVDDQRRILELHLLPVFGFKRLSVISPKLIENWMFDLRDRGLSAKRVNNVSGTLRLMLGEAVRLGQLHVNPFQRVRPLAGADTRRKLLTLEEVRALFSAKNIEEAWKGHLLYRAVNLMAAATGCRQGELLAIREEDIHEEWVHVAHSWHLKYGLGPTKTRQERDVPVPQVVLDALEPFRGTGGFVFSMNRGVRPVTGCNVTRALYMALEAIGIPREEQIRRNLTFHSWRSWFNSLMRARAVPTALLQRVTGHATAQMVERYTHFQLADFHDVTVVQGEIFEDGDKAIRRPARKN